MKHICLFFLGLLVLVGCQQEHNPKGVQPSEIMVSQEAEIAVKLSDETLEVLYSEKIEVFSAQLNPDGTHQYFFIHEYIGGEENFVVEGTYNGKSFSVEMPEYDKRLAFTAAGVAFCQTKLLEANFPTWECTPISLD